MRRPNKLHRMIAILLAAAFVSTGLIVPAAAGNTYKETYTVTAAPMPMPWVGPHPMRGCRAGAEGVHKSSKDFVVPFSGWLDIDLAFSGDWDLYLLDSDGDLLAFSNYGNENLDTGLETISYFVRRGQSVSIVVCNLAGTPQAEVELRLTSGAAFTAAPAKERSVTRTYRAPVAGAQDSTVACFRAAGMGCPGVSLRPGDRRVTVDIEDDNAAAVAGFVYQYNGTTGYGGEWFCGRTLRPVRIKPGADLVAVSIKAVATCNGTPSYATSGTVTFRVSG